MYEQPPTLPFTSLQNIKSKAIDILDMQRTANTPESEFQNFEPVQEDKDKKKPKSSKACDFCKKKKIKCDINYVPPDKCTRTTCQCMYHIFDQDDTDDITDIPASNAFRDPGLTLSGHFTGETSFCSYLPTTEQPSVITEEDNLPTLTTKPAAEPLLTMQDKHDLVHIYYDNMNPFFPFMNKRVLLTELAKVFSQRKSHLSPLFFYALFARAASLANDHKRLSDDRSIRDVGRQCFLYASALVSEYTDKSRIGTILALVILTNQLEQGKRYKDLTRSSLWAATAFRMALDLGIHRASILDEDTYDGQLCIRTFWLAFITDSTISMMYGRPSSTEEKLLDTQHPKNLSSDDHKVSKWIRELNVLIEQSKATSRIIRFNYCPPPMYTVCGPVRRHNAFIVTYDSCLYDSIQPKQAESPMSDQPNQIVMAEDLISRRLEFQKSIFFYANLLLLHRPHVNDVIIVKNAKKTYSYSICSYAAVLITNIADNLDSDDLNYHAQCPVLVYALVMAIRIHILNATKPDAEKYNASINYRICLSILRRLPQSQDKSTMLFDAIQDLKRQADNNFRLAKLHEEKLRMEQKAQQQQRLNQPVLTASQVVFSPGTTENSTTAENIVNLEIPCIGVSETNTPLRFVEKGNKRKGKRPPPPTDNPSKKQRKQKQKQPSPETQEHVSTQESYKETDQPQPQQQQQQAYFHFYHSPDQILAQPQELQQEPSSLDQQQLPQQQPLFEQHTYREVEQPYQPLFEEQIYRQAEQPQQQVNYHFIHNPEQPQVIQQATFDPYFPTDDNIWNYLSLQDQAMLDFYSQQPTLGLTNETAWYPITSQENNT